MATIRSGILSRTTGKVGGVVGASWKGINYIREHVVPANPQTEAQQGQRAKMRKAVAFAKPIIGAVLNVYMDPLTRKMSAFNRWIKRNINQMPTGAGTALITLTEGNLAPCQDPEIEADAPGQFLLSCAVTQGSLDLPTDTIMGAVYSRTNKVWYFANQEELRSTNNRVNLMVKVSGTENPANCVAWCWAVRRDGSQVSAVSTSTAQVAFAA